MYVEDSHGNINPYAVAEFSILTRTETNPNDHQTELSGKCLFRNVNCDRSIIDPIVEDIHRVTRHVYPIVLNTNKTVAMREFNSSSADSGFHCSSTIHQQYSLETSILDNPLYVAKDRHISFV